MNGRTIYLVCCRVWPCSRWASMGRCGLCGQRPRRKAEPGEVVKHLEATARLLVRR